MLIVVFPTSGADVNQEFHDRDNRAISDPARGTKTIAFDEKSGDLSAFFER
jgi:hypothetical protein